MKLSVAILSLAILSGGNASFAQTDKQDKKAKAYMVADAHLDTQWNWDVVTTIDEYVKNTLEQNLALLDKYPNFRFNFEGAIRYKWMKEYYPAQYARLQSYIDSDRWHVSGCAVDANDVMVSSAEAIMRNWLYGSVYYKNEFGVRGGRDIMLPDCFGFPYTLPSLAAHCGHDRFSYRQTLVGLGHLQQSAALRHLAGCRRLADICRLQAPGLRFSRSV